MDGPIIVHKFDLITLKAHFLEESRKKSFLKKGEQTNS